jgi:hypothetical protein
MVFNEEQRQIYLYLTCEVLRSSSHSLLAHFLSQSCAARVWIKQSIFLKNPLTIRKQKTHHSEKFVSALETGRQVIAPQDYL